MIKATINGTLRNHDIRAQDSHSHKVTQNGQMMVILGVLRKNLSQVDKLFRI